eukprot:Unigene13159_Nuclearia_a/m.39858 Unigene13159_Nuclearia_a/g.39858  ORF Unigene13159_Nuclearia_a/g.39858 Unigene13159_Nuclearia_a/m.39858 type:complete len:280 (-) Unigene13159_Nuclearia_a:37-876(-)
MDLEGVVQSWRAAHARYEERVAQGTQPVPVVTEYILGGIAVYLTVTATLYAVMWRRHQQAPPSAPAGFKLTGLLLVYNAICVALAGYVVVGFLYVRSTYGWPATFACNPPEDTSELGRWSTHLLFVFFAQKFWEFLDTWFFILRCKFDQVSFLHVYHHASIVAVVGFLMPYNFSGDMYLPMVANSFVHVVMYSYYALSSQPQFKGLTNAIKPHITTMQLVQFVAIAYQNVLSYTRGSACMPNLFMSALLVLYMITMIVLFSNFFVAKYLSGGGKAKRAS